MILRNHFELDIFYRTLSLCISIDRHFRQTLKKGLSSVIKFAHLTMKHIIQKLQEGNYWLCRTSSSNRVNDRPRTRYSFQSYEGNTISQRTILLKRENHPRLYVEVAAGHPEYLKL